MATQDWSEAVHERIAGAIKRARQGKMTAQQLADETQRLGCPISRAQIANYESGRRQSMDVTEMLILAAALRVPPVALLFPGLPDGDTEVLPERHMTAAEALFWFTGETTDDDQDTDETQLVSLTHRRLVAENKLRRLYEGIELARRPGDQDLTDNIVGLTTAAEEVAELNRQMSAINRRRWHAEEGTKWLAGKDTE